MTNEAEMLAQYLLLQKLLKKRAYDDVEEVVDVMVEELRGHTGKKDGE